MSNDGSRELRGAHWSKRPSEDARESDRIEAALEEVEGLLDAGDDEGALKRLGEIPLDRPIDPELHVETGDCYFELEQLDQAERHYRRALELDPALADALHGVGLVHQAREEHEPMVTAWLEVRRLDLLEPELPWAISVDEFVETAESAFAELPKEVLENLGNLPIVVTDYPEEALIREGVDPRTLGLITGVPFSHKRLLDGPPELDCVQLYQRNIERVAGSKEEVLEEVRITVLHETAHYFGLDDDDLEALGLG